MLTRRNPRRNPDQNDFQFFDPSKIFEVRLVLRLFLNFIDRGLFIIVNFPQPCVPCTSIQKIFSSSSFLILSYKKFYPAGRSTLKINQNLEIAYIPRYFSLKYFRFIKILMQPTIHLRKLKSIVIEKIIYCRIASMTHI